MNIRFKSVWIMIFGLAWAGLLFSQELAAPADEANPKLSGAYLGQKPPGLIPEIFAPGIVSTDAFEFSVAFSPDGRELVFTRRPELTKPGNRLMYMKEENGVWTAPQLAPFAEDCVEYEPFMSPDGRRVFFNSERPHPVTGKKMVNDEKVWYSERAGSGWGKAKYLEGIINTGWIMNPAITLDGTIYICGEVDGKGGILRSKPVDGEYQSVESVFKGAHPYVSPDESTIIFDRAGKSWEETELYISQKTKAGEWTEPEKLGPEINATKTEAYGLVTIDGKYFFFNRGGDIYWVDTKVLPAYQAE
jgi:hypothetical protein